MRMTLPAGMKPGTCPTHGPRARLYLDDRCVDCVEAETRPPMQLPSEMDLYFELRQAFADRPDVRLYGRSRGESHLVLCAAVPERPDVIAVAILNRHEPVEFPGRVAERARDLRAFVDGRGAAQLESRGSCVWCAVGAELDERGRGPDQIAEAIETAKARGLDGRQDWLALERRLDQVADEELAQRETGQAIDAMRRLDRQVRDRR